MQRVSFALSDTTQRRKEQTRNSSPYVLRILFVSLLIFSINAILFALHFEAFVASVNLLLFSSIVLLYYAIGSTLDKKLVLWSFRLYKWTLNHGFIEDADQGIDVE